MGKQLEWKKGVEPLPVAVVASPVKDYKELVEGLKSPTWQDIEDPDSSLLSDAAAAITELLMYKEAVDRMGAFGKLFIPYKGDPRGSIGRAGGLSLEEEAVIMPVLEDIDGGKWRPVNEDVLRDLFARIEGSCKPI